MAGLANGCCPNNYTFIQPNGTFIDPAGNYQVVSNFKLISYTDQAPCWQVQLGANTLYNDPVSTIPCPCCPQYYVLANKEGYVSLIAGNIVLVGPQAANKCVFLQDFSVLVDPGDCPCCPDGYVYNSGGDFCVSVQNGIRDNVPTIPCIPCVCVTTTPFVCPTCGTEGERITFQFNFFKKNCTACVPQGFNPPKGRINNFLPNLFTDPDPSGFILKQ